MNPQLSTKTSATRDERRVVVPFQNSAPVAKIKKFVFIRDWWFKKTYFLPNEPISIQHLQPFLKNHPPKTEPKRTQFSSFLPDIFLGLTELPPWLSDLSH